MHDLWLQAGGGTDAYDPERYVGLLRDHGLAKPRVSLTEIVRTVILQTAGGVAEELDESAVKAFAKVLTDELGKHGYRIHDVVRCVRPTGDPLTVGRPMTAEEEQQLVIEGEPLPHPRRRRA